MAKTGSNAEMGYVIASHQVTLQKKRIGYLYREAPDNDLDSGWRVFSGEESQEYVDNAANFSMYNSSTIAALAPEIALLLAHPSPIAFERDPSSGRFVEVLPPPQSDEA